MNALYRWNAVVCGLFISWSALANATVKNECSNALPPLSQKSELELISDKFAFLEGPTWSMQQQAFYFSEMHFSRDEGNGPYSNIYQLILPDNISLFKSDSGSNGLLAMPDKLILMDHSVRGVSALPFSNREQKSDQQILVANYQGHLFNSPNDLAISKTGTFYFSDPDWQLNGRIGQLGYTGLFSMSNDNEVVLIDKTLHKPNGVALSPNERWLYVGDYSHQVYRYSINEHGEINAKEPFIKIDTPDGITVDCAGNVYIAAHVKGTIQIYNQTGKLIGSVKIGHKVTNMAFGGEDLKTLLITTAKGLYKITTNIPGKALL